MKALVAESTDFGRGFRLFALVVIPLVVVAAWPPSSSSSNSTARTFTWSVG
jgi:hypothetical protein